MPTPTPKYAEPDPPSKRESRGPSPPLSDRDNSADAGSQAEAPGGDAIPGGSPAQPFVEVSELLRERDAALETADRVASALDKLEEKLETLSRERDAAVRQREELARRSKGGKGDANGAAVQIADMQRQLVSIRQARDDAQAQNRELAAKLTALEDELAELGYIRDGARNSARQAEKEAAEIVLQLETAKQEREASAQQIANLQRELETERRKNSELTTGSGAMLAGEEQAAGIAEAQRVALEASAQEIANLQRDLEEERRKPRHTDTTAQIAELTGLLKAREHELETKSLETAALRNELEEGRRTIEALRAQVEELLVERKVAATAGDAASPREQELLVELRAQEDRQTALTEQVAELQRSRDEALTSLTAAQKQIEHIVRERDLIRQQGIESTLETETQIVALRAQVASGDGRSGDVDKRVEAAQRERDEALVKASQFEKQRLQAIDLAAQLDTAKRELITLCADLAEARLQAKYAQTGGAPPKPRKKARVEPAEPITVEISLDAPSGQLEGDKASAEEELPAVHDPLTEKAAKRMVSTMKQCFEAFHKDTKNLAPLAELQTQAQNFSEDARVSGFVALHRLGGAFAALAQHLTEFKESINQSTLRTISQTVDFLGVLVKRKDYAALKDPAKAVVYAVDDDKDNCEAIQMSMETVMLRTQCAQEPSVALAELASGRFDLIFLDVSIPSMDGFELCQQIRQLALHRDDPDRFHHRDDHDRESRAIEPERWRRLRRETLQSSRAQRQGADLDLEGVYLGGF